MNNTKKTTTLAVAAIFIAAALVVGGALAATTSATQSALAYSNKKKGGDENSNNGNTVTIQKCKQAAIQSGWDNDQEQECENLICTHPGENATCVQEGVVTTTTTPTPTPTPTTIRVTGQGEGSSTCPTSTPLDASIAFNVVQQPGSAVQGNFQISVSTGLVKSGTLDSVQITGNSFTITETETTQTGPKCTFSQLPSSATITGQCGTGVTIDFATADGETARFTNANVQCTTSF